jgi:microcompartment protein CcmL/EutN
MAVKSAIGILETRGFAPLVIGADAALKAANVEMVEWRQVGSGFVSFTIQGADAASKVGEVVSQLVIPRPVEELDTTFNR